MSRIRDLARKWHLHRIYQALRIDKLPQKRAINRLRQQFQYGSEATIDLDSSGGTAKLLVKDAEELGAVLHSKDDIGMMERVMSYANSSDLVWDIGANIGVYSVIFAKIIGTSGQVVCFEPESKSRLRLSENIQINELGNVHIVPIALGDHNDDSAELSVSVPPASGTHRIGITSGNNVEMVIIITGDDALKRYNLEQPNIIKIDVEGYEEKVLLGMPGILGSADLRAILCEIHFRIFSEMQDSDAPARIVSLLKRNGFKTTWLDFSHLLAFR